MFTQEKELRGRGWAGCLAVWLLHYLDLKLNAAVLHCQEGKCSTRQSPLTMRFCQSEQQHTP